MPYKETQSKLKDLIAHALHTEEIKYAADVAELDEVYLASAVEYKAADIWRAAASEIEVYNQLEDSLKAKLLELRETEAAVDHHPSPRSLRWLDAGVLVLGLVGFSVIFSVILLTLLSLPVNLRYIFPLASIIVGTVLLYFYRTDRLRQWFWSDDSLRRDDENLAEKQRQLAMEVSALEEELKTAEQAIERAIIEKGILPELRVTINDLYLPSYDTRLPGLIAPGLAEIFNPEHEVPTESMLRLRRLLDTMPGGNIGVAGPRGAGKTMLIRSLCSTAWPREVKGHPVLSVMTAVPAEYTAREFILHVFSALCLRMLELRASAFELLGAEELPHRDEIEIPALLPMRFLTKAGAKVLPGLAVIVAEQFISGGLSPNLSRLLLGLGFFAVVLAVVAGLLRLVTYMQHRRRAQLAKQRREISDEAGQRDPLSLEALTWLRKIKFQQSYSRGWAGHLALPMGIQGDAAVSLSRNQMSLPEVVDSYLQFVTFASREYEVIVGIDQLDKLESDDVAQHFLNDLSGLFGSEHCFYLLISAQTPKPRILAA